MRLAGRPVRRGAVDNCYMKDSLRGYAKDQAGCHSLLSVWASSLMLLLILLLPSPHAGSDSTTFTPKPGTAPIAAALQKLFYTLLNWRFSVPFLINQCGSLVYVYLLGSTDISMAVPICNSLTFVFTGIAARLLGDKEDFSWKKMAGTACVLTGVAICVHSKA